MEIFSKYYITKFSSERRKVNQYAVVSEIIKVTGDKPKISVAAATDDSFLEEVAINK